MALLGAGGNATVAKSGSWAAGIGLTPTTGAVSTTAAVPAGTYTIPYTLCDLNTPKNCATVVDTITVNLLSIAANADTGSADQGYASRPIANVTANDTVNGAQAMLGAGGNATVAIIAPWSAGIALAPAAGAVAAGVASKVIDNVTFINPQTLTVPVAATDIAVSGGLQVFV